MISKMDKIDLTKSDKSVVEVYREQRDKGAYDPILETYKDPATVYAWMVLEGRIVAGEFIQLDSFRHLQDLRRIDEDDTFNYVYDLSKCKEILNFSKLVPDVSTGKPLPLMLWQQAILCKAQGWRTKTGEKRFSRVLLSVARTNGKSFLSAILISYGFIVECSGLFNQDLGFILPVTAQAKKTFSYIKTTFQALSELSAFKKLFKDEAITVLDDQVISRKNQNKLLRLSHESGKLDSFHFQTIVSDEAGNEQMIGKIKDNNGKITSGQVQTANSQFIQISTSYPDSNSYFYTDENMLKEAMKKDYDRALDDYLCMAWMQDSLEETQPENYEAWEKSNPILGLKSKHDSMLKSLIADRDTALSDGTLTKFQNKNLNIWLQTKVNSAFELKDINSSVVQEAPIDIRGRDVYVGWDLSHFSDDTSISFIFPYIENNKEKYFIYEHSWVPLARAQNNLNIKEKTDGINYTKAEARGFVTIANNEYGYIEANAPYEWLLEFVTDNELNVEFFNYDAWQSEDIILNLDQKTDWNLMPIRQGTRSLNQPTVEFRKALSTEAITYLDDPIIKASLTNAVILTDNNGIKIDKDKATSKIDFVDATINAFSQAMYYYKDINPNAEKTKSPFRSMSNDEINNYFSNDFSF